ncbi:alcohol dehydrogenase catalytic domain-containing protein [Halorarius halobius]|uniref:alcohol dehydrogenase catalytic domain-containing protein n=1 Tax=Halorarius halobius TaxID=2962671 RepID=UPI0020CD8063|nr:alcohol dehydrogenase catalytic domain-containing protein [Halorarius halobius]
MRAAVIPDESSGYRIEDRPVPDPDPDDVRVAVDACGVCRGDDVVVEGNPAVEYPRVPGHEIVGTVDAVGADVTEWEPGDRVGVGWHGGHCFTCDACRRGDFVLCGDKPVTGIHRDGGYAEFTLARPEALVAVPDELDSAEAAPLLCAGLTSFNALRNADAGLGDLVAVVGIGGLGHLGVAYAHEAGFETVAISRGTDKRAAAHELGADHYVDSEREDPAEALQALGGADLVLSTAPASDAVAAVVEGLGADGEVCNVGFPEESVPVNVSHLGAVRGSVSGGPSGSPCAAEETLEFGALRNVTPRVERFDLAEVGTAYRRMDDGDVRFRAVVTP